MRVTTKRIVAIHLALAVAGFVALMVLACEPWPDPPPLGAEKCDAYGVTIDVTPDSAPCVFARMRIRRFVEVFDGKPGFDVERIRGVKVTVHEESDGAAFHSDGCSCDAGGDASCRLKRIRLASVHLHDLVHELAHIAEDCAKDETAPNFIARVHPKWTERDVYFDIFRAENG